MRTEGIAFAIVLAAGLAAPSWAQLPPEPPEAAAIASLLAEQPTQECNGAEDYLAAEEAWRHDRMQIPAEQALRLPEEHPVVTHMQRSARCSRFELPYSASIAIPPTDQPIPSSRVYWGAAAALVGRSERLRNAGRLDEARSELSRVVRLGLQLHADPGITYIQQLIAWKTIAMGVQALGDMALAGGQQEQAARCARVLAGARAYVDGLARFVREELTYAQQPEDPGLLVRVRRLSGFYAASGNRAVRGEILLFMALVQALADDAATGEAARATLASGTKDPDARLRQLAAWGLALERERAFALLKDLQRQPGPLTRVEDVVPQLATGQDVP